MVDVKAALEEAGGDINKAVEILRKNGTIKAASKSERQTKEGLIHSYIHSSGKVGALIEVQCETDFVARNQAFQNLVHDLAMQVVAGQPLYLSPADVPAWRLKKKNHCKRKSENRRQARRP